MRRIWLIIILPFSIGGFAQSAISDGIKFEGALEVLSPIYEEYRIKDSTALIIVLSWNGSWPENRNYIVFHPDKTIEVIDHVEPINDSKKSKWKKRSVKNRDMNAKFWSLLDSCISHGLFELDQEQLDIDSKYDSKSGKTQRISVSHGVLCSFAIIKGKKYLNYSSFSPDTYIRAEFPGANERKKFLVVLNSFAKLIELESEL